MNNTDIVRLVIMIKTERPVLNSILTKFWVSWLVAITFAFFYKD